MTTDANTTINGVLVELEFYDDEANSCWLSVETKSGRYAGSLGLCESMGGIPYDPGTGPDDGPEIYPLPTRVLDQITGWATQHGY